MAVAATLLALTAVAGCLDGDAPAGAPPPVDAAPARIPPEAWKAALSKPVYEGVVDSIESLAAADGARLSLSLHLPAGLEPGARIPTLLQLTPYQSYLAPDGDPGPASPSWADYVLRGAAYVEADARGTGTSEGCLDFGGSLDRADAVAFAEWIRAQPWSNGVIVADGISHPGMGAVVAHAAVPGLAGALAHAPVVSYYRDEWYDGAKFEDQVNGAGYQEVELTPSVVPDPDGMTAQAAPCTGDTLADYNQADGRLDALWDDRDLSRHHEAAASPILLTQGFVDQNVHPDHVQLYWDSLPEDFPKSVIWGWWYHGWPDMDGHPAEEFEDLRHRWLDALLFGLGNGLAAEPRVLVEDSQGTWHEGHRWPLEPSETVTLWADGAGSGGLLAPSPPATESGASYRDAPGARRGSWTGAHAAFRTEPLPKARLVNGAPVVDLVASSDATATKWVLYLLDEAPDGTWKRITHGYADSHTWNGEAEWEALQPGTRHNWTVRLMPTAVVVEAGHRVTLVVASQDSRLPASFVRPPGADALDVCFDDHRGGCYAPSGILPAESAGRATNTVHGGPDGTRVTLAWVDPAATAKVPWPA
jgi:hypothetical protein